ncbi:MAG: PorV/PorQ family protein [Fibrobacteres bacterium]|nr:PorV/PorQ family protein [Fibrobacterota bacterium]
MNLKQIVITFLLFMLLVPANLLAVGQAALPTLGLINNSRYVALGEAGGAVCYDQGAIQLNPAGLWFINKDNKSTVNGHFDFEYLLPEFGIKGLYHSYFSLYGNYKNQFSFGISNQYISFGESEWINELGKPLGTFESFDNFLILSLASDLEINNSQRKSNYSLGINVKFIYSKLSDVPVGNEKRKGVSYSLAADVGVLYREPFLNVFSAGLTLQNMGADVVYIDQNQADPLPFNIKLSFGSTYEIPKLIKFTAVLDLNKEHVKRRDEESLPPDLCFKAIITSWDEPLNREFDEIVRSYGLEIVTFDMFALRAGGMVDKAGWRWERTYGCGFQMKHFDISIASRKNLNDRGTARSSSTTYSMELKAPF